MTDTVPTTYSPGARVSVSAPRVRGIIAEVAQAHRLQPRDLTGHDRFAHMILARHEAIWRVRVETKISSPQIGRFFGGRDHTTILWACRRHQQRLEAARGA